MRYTSILYIDIPVSFLRFARQRQAWSSKCSESESLYRTGAGSVKTDHDSLTFEAHVKWNCLSFTLVTASCGNSRLTLGIPGRLQSVLYQRDYTSECYFINLGCTRLCVILMCTAGRALCKQTSMIIPGQTGFIRRYRNIQPSGTRRGTGAHITFCPGTFQGRILICEVQ